MAIVPNSTSPPAAALPPPASCGTRPTTARPEDGYEQENLMPPRRRLMQFELRRDRLLVSGVPELPRSTKAERKELLLGERGYHGGPGVDAEGLVPHCQRKKTRGHDRSRPRRHLAQSATALSQKPARTLNSHSLKLAALWSHQSDQRPQECSPSHALVENSTLQATYIYIYIYIYILIHVY